MIILDPLTDGEAVRREDLTHAVALVLAEFVAEVAAGLQILAVFLRDGTVKVQPVLTAVEGHMGFKIPDADLQRLHIPRPSWASST